MVSHLKLCFGGKDIWNQGRLDLNLFIYYCLTTLINSFPPPQGLIFVVDSNDRERIQEAAEELQKMVTFNQNMNIFYANVTTEFLLKNIKTGI